MVFRMNQDLLRKNQLGSWVMLKNNPEFMLRYSMLFKSTNPFYTAKLNNLLKYRMPTSRVNKHNNQEPFSHKIGGKHKNSHQRVLLILFCQLCLHSSRKRPGDLMSLGIYESSWNVLHVFCHFWDPTISQSPSFPDCCLGPRSSSCCLSSTW